MNNTAFKYSIIRFAPFVETQEFANIGILLLDKKKQRLLFKLEKKRYARITQFFDDIENKLYVSAIHGLTTELERCQKLSRDFKTNPEEVFHEITRAREAIIKFGDTRVVLGTNGEEILDRLFKHYVRRNFLTKEYKEQNLEKSVRSILKQHNLNNIYARKTLTDGIYEASFPFVSEIDRKIIKPLHLAHEKPSQTLDHGLAWLHRVNELRKRDVITSDVLFTVDEPSKNTKVHQAYLELMGRYKDNHINVLNVEDEAKIAAFAR